jgi:hypothetical protein
LPGRRKSSGACLADCDLHRASLRIVELLQHDERPSRVQDQGRSKCGLCAIRGENPPAAGTCHAGSARF